MAPIIKKHGASIAYIITGIVVVVSALLFKNTQYENAWLYIFCVGTVIASILEVYSKKSK